MDEEVLTTAQAAARLGVAVRTLRIWVRAGRLPRTYLHVGSRQKGYRIYPSDLEAVRYGGGPHGPRQPLPR